MRLSLFRAFIFLCIPIDLCSCNFCFIECLYSKVSLSLSPGFCLPYLYASKCLPIYLFAYLYVCLSGRIPDNYNLRRLQQHPFPHCPAIQLHTPQSAAHTLTTRWINSANCSSVHKERGQPLVHHARTTRSQLRNHLLLVHIVSLMTRCIFRQIECSSFSALLSLKLNI